MKQHSVLALLLAIAVAPLQLQAATFVPTSGNHFWNDNNNWGPGPPQPFPNASGASAIIPGPTAALSIDLGQPITIGFLEIQKPATPDSGNTTITGPNSLTFAGAPMSLNNRTGTGAGVSVIDVPVVFNSTLTVNQESNEQLRFTQSLSGIGGLTLNRLAAGPAGARLIVLTAANGYGGATTISNAAGGDDLMVIRLNNATAIPAASNISVGGSSVLEIASGSFTRGLTGPGALSFTGAGRNGFSAVDATRTVNLGGAGATVTWGNAAGQANFGQLVLGSTTANAMVDFVNPLNLNTGGNRNIRSYNGTGIIDGRISGAISGNGQVTKLSDGVLSFAGANVYTGGTRIEEGLLRLDHANALPATGAVTIGQGATLGIGADTAPGDPNADFARTLGSGSGQFQMVAIGNAGNQANAGLSAHNGNRSVVFNAGGMLTWGTNFFLSGMNAGTPNRNLILSDESADGALNLKNPIDLNGADRTITTRNGTADVDAELSGVLSGIGGLIKENTGTLVLSNANTYDGTTSVVRGRLLVNNTSGSGTGTGPVSVSTGATLGGTGAIAGTVTVNSGAHIAPGASIESLDVGGLTIEAGSILDFELGTPLGIPGVNNDLLNVLGTTTLNGVGEVRVTDAGGMALGRYTIIDYAGALTGSGVSAFLDQIPTGPAGFSYRLRNTGSTIDLVVAIPEPATLALVSIAAMIVMQRRSRWRGK